MKRGRIDEDDSSQDAKRARVDKIVIPEAPCGLVEEIWKCEIIKRHLIDVGFGCRTLVALRRTCKWFALNVIAPRVFDKSHNDTWRIESLAAIREWHRDPKVANVLAWNIRPVFMWFTRVWPGHAKELYNLAFEAVKLTASAEVLDLLYHSYTHMDYKPTPRIQFEFKSMVFTLDSPALFDWFIILHDLGHIIAYRAAGYLCEMMQCNAMRCFTSLYRKQYGTVRSWAWKRDRRIINMLGCCTDEFLRLFIDVVEDGQLRIIPAAATAGGSHILEWVFPGVEYRHHDWLWRSDERYHEAGRVFMVRAERLFGSRDDPIVDGYRVLRTKRIL